jgi:hypothetical protein
MPFGASRECFLSQRINGIVSTETADKMPPAEIGVPEMKIIALDPYPPAPATP